jgi:hypothetical protein
LSQRLSGGGASSESNLAELLLGVLRVPDVAHGFLVRPALFPRLVTHFSLPVSHFEILSAGLMHWFAPSKKDDAPARRKNAYGN